MAAFRQGEAGRARACVEEAIQLVRELETTEGNTDLAQTILQEECLPRSEEMGEIRAGRIRHSLGDVMNRQGEMEEAESLYKPALEVRRRKDDKWGVAETLERLAGLARNGGNRKRSRQLHVESLTLDREMSNKQGILDCLEGLAELGLDEERTEVAVRLLGAAEAREYPHETTEF